MYDVVAGSAVTERHRVGAAVVSVGSAFPRRSIATAEIEDRLGLDRNWIVKRTGVRRRYRAYPGAPLSDLGATAARRALDEAGLDPDDLDLVFLATMTPEDPTPVLAARIAKQIGAGRAGAVDIGAACSGFLGALSMATGCIESGRAERVLVVGGDLMSRLIDDDDRVTAGIFGDGAGAVVVCRVDGPSQIGPYVLGSDGADADAIVARRPSGPIRMDGQRTFRRAVDCLVDISREAVRRAGWSLEDVDLVVPHQANARITKAVRERLGLSPERVLDCIATYGNTTGGTLPTALAVAHRTGRLRPGSRVLLAAFGAGLTWGALMLTWHGPQTADRALPGLTPREMLGAYPGRRSRPARM
jgi:3-oxoacyl-[acyl-carrier-protein] synthase III